MHHVLHDFPDEDVVRILSQLAQAMTPGYSKLLLGENILRDIDCGIYGALMDWSMMALHSGGERTVSGWGTLCEKAGLSVVKYWPHPSDEDGDGILELVTEAA